MSEQNSHVTLLTDPPSITEVREGEYIIVVGVPANLYTKREIKHPQVLFAGRQEFVSFAANGLPGCVKAVLTTDSCANHLAHDDTFHARVRIHVLNSPQIIRDALSLINFADGSSFAKTLDGSQLATEEMRPKLKDTLKVEATKHEPPQTKPAKALPNQSSAETLLTVKPLPPQQKKVLPTVAELSRAAEETFDKFRGKPNQCRVGGVDFFNRPHVACALMQLYPEFDDRQIRELVSQLGEQWAFACEVGNTARQLLSAHGQGANYSSGQTTTSNGNGQLSLAEENRVLRKLLLLTTTTLDTVESELRRFHLKD